MGRGGLWLWYIVVGFQIQQEVEFGTTLPTAAGLQLVISVADLYHGAALPTGHAAGDIVAIDLAALQAEILSDIN